LIYFKNFNTFSIKTCNIKAELGIIGPRREVKYEQQGFGEKFILKSDLIDIWYVNKCECIDIDNTGSTNEQSDLENITQMKSIHFYTNQFDNDVDQQDRISDNIFFKDHMTFSV